MRARGSVAKVRKSALSAPTGAHPSWVLLESTRAWIGLPAAATLRDGPPCPSLRAAPFSREKSYLFFSFRGIDNGVHYNESVFGPDHPRVAEDRGVKS
jgi:hypothetical protein